MSDDRMTLRMLTGYPPWKSTLRNISAGPETRSWALIDLCLRYCLEDERLSCDVHSSPLHKTLTAPVTLQGKAIFILGHHEPFDICSALIVLMVKLFEAVLS